VKRDRAPRDGTRSPPPGTTSSNAWQQYHALGTDQTHTNAAGAVKIAGFVTSAMKTQGIALSQYLRN
jgi:hypothetical protein